MEICTLVNCHLDRTIVASSELTPAQHQIRQASNSSSSETVNENCLMEQKIAISIRSRPFVFYFTHFSRIPILSEPLKQNARTEEE